MTLKSRLSLYAGAAMAAAMLLVSAVIFLAVRSQLRAQIDRYLVDRAAVIADTADRGRISRRMIGRGGREFPTDVPPPHLGGPSGLTQLVLEDGTTLAPRNQEVAIPIDDQSRAVAAGTQPQFFTDAQVEGGRIRVLTTPVSDGLALQIARPLNEVDQFLRWLLIVLATGAVGGTLLAGGLGRVVASTALSPVRDLTDAAERVALTKDLAERISSDGADELGRLASSFNAMLEALDASLKSQRQLVADASHELRTPLTSLRTNIEVLARNESMDRDEKEKLLADVIGQLDELTVLMGDLIELARGEEPDLLKDKVRLDELAENAVERARRNWPSVRFAAKFSASTVEAVPSRVERAIGNLLDNAAKWSSKNGEVEVNVAGGEVRVHDRGPGIPETDLPHVFDRFYRAAGARGMPGSGIGLAIVRQVAQSHGGTVSAENAKGGGAVLRLRLPAIS